MEDILVMSKDVAKKLIKKVKDVRIYTDFYRMPIDELERKLQIYIDTYPALDLNQYNAIYNGYNRLKKHTGIVFYKWDFHNRVNNGNSWYDIELDINEYYVELTHSTGAYIFCSNEQEYRDLQGMRREYINEIKEKYKPVGVKGYSDDMIFNRADGVRLIKDYDEILKKYREKAVKILSETKIQRLERQLAEEKAKAGIK